MKRIMMFILLVFSSFVIAGKVEIVSDTMHATETNKEVHFEGNVKVTEEKSWIASERLTVYFNDQNKTKTYKASGHVIFELYAAKGHYVGSAAEVHYFPIVSQYLFEGDVKLHDTLNKRDIYGEKVTLDKTTGVARITGKPKKPVKFVIETNETKAGER